MPNPPSIDNIAFNNRNNKERPEHAHALQMSSLHPISSTLHVVIARISIVSFKFDALYAQQSLATNFEMYLEPSKLIRNGCNAETFRLSIYSSASDAGRTSMTDCNS